MCAGAPCTGPLKDDTLMRIVGEGASDAAGRGNVNAGDGGVAFIVTSAAGVPGGLPLIMQLVTGLRAAAHFVIVVVTRPFAFEGAAKADQADSLVSLLEVRGRGGGGGCARHTFGCHFWFGWLVLIGSGAFFLTILNYCAGPSEHDRSHGAGSPDAGF